MTAYELRSYPGGAPDTLLTGNINATALTFGVTAGTGSTYPDGSSGPFYVVVDYDNASAEKIRVTSRSGDTFTVASTSDRGVDGTTALSHSVPAKVRACWTATDAQEANRAAHYTVGQVTTKGDLLVGTAANTLARVGVGTNGQQLVADSTQAAGVKWAAGSSGASAWTGPIQPFAVDSNTVTVGTRVSYYRFRCQETVTLTGLRLGVALSSANLEVGIYSDSAGSPANRLATSGMVACPAAGMRTVALSVTLTAGTDYWLAIVTSTSGSQFYGKASNAVPTTYLADVMRTESVAALPAVATPTSPPATNAVVLLGYVT